MQTTIDTAAGWASVTDVTCPFCRVGILRWAEAGYVPGWRQCDACTAQYLGDPATGRLQNKRRGKRVTAQRLAAAQAARQAGIEYLRQIDVKLGSAAGTRDLGGSWVGPDWHYYQGNVGDLGPDWLGAYNDAWRAGATPEALAVLDEIGQQMPGCVSLSAISRDGQRVNLYHRRRADGLFGGTTIVSIEGLRRAVASQQPWWSSDHVIRAAQAN